MPFFKGPISICSSYKLGIRPSICEFCGNIIQLITTEKATEKTGFFIYCWWELKIILLWKK
jgi:hypothetical protein